MASQCPLKQIKCVPPYPCTLERMRISQIVTEHSASRLIGSVLQHFAQPHFYLCLRSAHNGCNGSRKTRVSTGLPKPCQTEQCNITIIGILIVYPCLQCM